MSNISSVQGSNTFTQPVQPSCLNQISSAMLWTLKSPFMLVYYASASIVHTASYYLFGYGPGAIAPSGSNYTSQDLKEVWEETEKLLQFKKQRKVSNGTVFKTRNYEYQSMAIPIDQPGKTTRQSSFWFDSSYDKSFSSNGHETTFNVVNKDGVYAASDLKKQYNKVALLNPANAYTPGGGTRGGSAAMEEDLCRRSALLPELEKQSYPLKDSALLYTPDVPFFRYGRDRHYAFMKDPVKISVITSAAIDLNPNHNSKKIALDAFKKETKQRIYAQLWKAAEEGNEAVVLTAFGCGAFQNSPEIVAQCYKEILDTKFQGVFKNVTFAIIDDHNAKKAHNPRGNFKPFFEVFG